MLRFLSGYSYLPPCRWEKLRPRGVYALPRDEHPV